MTTLLNKTEALLRAERDEARAVAERMRAESGSHYPLPWEIDASDSGEATTKLGRWVSTWRGDQPPILVDLDQKLWVHPEYTRPLGWSEEDIAEVVAGKNSEWAYLPERSNRP